MTYLSGHGARILVGEADDALLDLLRELLEAEGHGVVAVTDGFDLLDAIVDSVLEGDVRPFDVVVVTSWMPDLCGVEILEEIRRYEPRIPVVVLDEECPAEDRSRLRALDALLLHDLVCLPGLLNRALLAGAVGAWT